MSDQQTPNRSRLVDQIPGNLAQRIELQPGQVLFQQGQHQEHVFWVAAGHLKLEHVSSGGANCILAILGADAILWPTAPQGSASDQTASAKGDTRVYQFSVRNFEACLRQTPSLQTRCLQHMVERQAITDRRLNALVSSTVRERLIVVLRDLAHTAGGHCVHGHEIDVPLTQQELADLVGASRPVTSAELNTLRREGWLDYSRTHICMNDPTLGNKLSAK